MSSLSLLDPALEQTLRHDTEYLKQTKLPIITVSATFKEDLKGWHGLPDNSDWQDVVFSRAHYSMALALAASQWRVQDDLDRSDIDHRKAWIFDPTNYVSHKDWRSVQLTEVIGKTIARHPVLKKLKDIIDRFGRNKLPILNSITPPLLHVTREIEHPLLSLHIAAGNILADQGKKVVQVITDPHVREDYLKHAENKNVLFCVFDQRTKTEFLEKAAILGIKASSQRVVVTGPPIDPRIIATRHRKHPWRNGPLRLCITTGGLGTNKLEIKRTLEQLLPQLRRRPSPLRLMVYAGTQQDICELVRGLAHEHGVIVNEINSPHQKYQTDNDYLTLLHNSQIVDANELLIRYAFPWAHGFITKPSGDMAYDAVAAGCFLLTLSEWGVWEHSISEVFGQLEISRVAQVSDIKAQLKSLVSAQNKSRSWVEQAMHNALTIEPLFLEGTSRIIRAYRDFARQLKV